MLPRCTGRVGWSLGKKCPRERCDRDRSWGPDQSGVLSSVREVPEFPGPLGMCQVLNDLLLDNWLDGAATKQEADQGSQIFLFWDPGFHTGF